MNTNRSMLALLWVCLVLIVASCSSVDCPLNNTVYANYVLRGPVTTMPDTLTILTHRQDGTDSILINQQVNTDSFTLPVSYAQTEDVLVFHTGHLTDTVVIEKTNEPHFESVDCPATMFHTLQQVKCTHHRIDSVVINQNKVSYDAQKPHLLIYFKSLGS